MNMKQEQRVYAKPALKVVELQFRRLLMDSDYESGVSGKRESYGTAEELNWE